jgi:hypothetical protein
VDITNASSNLLIDKGSARFCGPQIVTCVTVENRDILGKAMSLTSEQGAGQHAATRLLQPFTRHLPDLCRLNSRLSLRHPALKCTGRVTIRRGPASDLTSSQPADNLAKSFALFPAACL